MDFALSPTASRLRDELISFMDEHVYPSEAVYEQQMDEAGDPLTQVDQLWFELEIDHSPDSNHGPAKPLLAWRLAFVGSTSALASRPPDAIITACPPPSSPRSKTASCASP